MISFDNTYVQLPPNFHKTVSPEKAPKPALIAYNHEFAKNELGLDLSECSEGELAALFSGQTVPEGASSIAMAYAGHQFGHFNHQLGDGRALLLGEVVTHDNKRYDLQLKGSGRTPFSRGGDGKSSLGPVIREYIVSEAMSYLGVPTTRALAAVTTGELVYREEALPGGVFTRVAASHIRIGTFEYFAGQGDVESVRLLANYAIDRHYPEIKGAENIYLAFIEAVARRQASLVAGWMALGFIHGVMNTDNMSISGETIDFGPCAFIDTFSFDKVFSSIDHGGRYAYNNQMGIAKWNLIKVANCLIPLIDEDPKKAVELCEESITGYIDVYEQEWLSALSKKFGIFEARQEDEKLINDFLQLLEDEKRDFTISFRDLIEMPDQFGEFSTAFKQRLGEQSQSIEEAFDLMKSVNPVYIPRNHQVERAIQAAIDEDYSIFHQMNEGLKRPYTEQAGFAEFAKPPEPEEIVTATFCGT